MSQRTLGVIIPKYYNGNQIVTAKCAKILAEVKVLKYALEQKKFDMDQDHHCFVLLEDIFHLPDKDQVNSASVQTVGFLKFGPEYSKLYSLQPDHIKTNVHIKVLFNVKGPMPTEDMFLRAFGYLHGGREIVATAWETIDTYEHALYVEDLMYKIHYFE